MNDWTEQRNRGKTLLVVEGHHEKDELFYRLIKCFPELNINQENIKIYGTNIYVLHRSIVDEYGPDWKEQEIDLPFLISKGSERMYSADFVNILLIFDYEHHDPFFSENAICDMLEYFNDSTDKGKLYINYPMVESYEHFNFLPDPTYENLSVPASLKPGSKYKELVQRTNVCRIMDFSERLINTLQRTYHVPDNRLCALSESLLDISSDTDLEKKILRATSPILAADDLQTAAHHLPKILTEIGNLSLSLSYWEYLRCVFSEIIIHNICKANKILGGNFNIEAGSLKEQFQQLSDIQILKNQNTASHDVATGFIWVLNTSVLFVAEYNFELVMNSRLP